MKHYFIYVLLFFCACACSDKNAALRNDFAQPPVEYRPMPLWHLNGQLTEEGIRKQIIEARDFSGYGGMTPLPVTPGPHWYDQHACPGMTPEYLSEAYFDMYIYMLEVSKEAGTQIILYDDGDFPSGSAGGRLLKEYPQYTRKYLIKDEFTTQGGRAVVKDFMLKDTQSRLAIAAMNIASLEVVDLQSFLDRNRLSWPAPQGEWKIMSFIIEYDVGPPHGHLVDYMEPAAVSKLMEMTYDEYDKRFHSYFGSVITKTFFDDVGFVFMDQTWNEEISTVFREKTGRNPALYYPALFYDIGAETQAARVAFFDARSELMAEGYVKQVSQWAEKRGMKSMGHPPENYSPNTVVTCGDVLKLYRHAQIPLLDVIFRYGRGRNGYKQISSAADIGDKGLVGAELNGAFAEDMDSLDLYRVAMESMVRGVNFLVPHGLWYDSDPKNIRIPPLISHENPYWSKDVVPDYSRFTSRSCVLLQDGRRVVDIALLWPVTAIQGETWIGRDGQSGLPVAHWLPDEVNHYELSGLLTDEVRRDFTYIHPDDLTSGKITINAGELILNNEINIQDYKVLVMPGGDVILASALKKIKEYYDSGGKVIATVALPTRSGEFGRDDEVKHIITDIFGQYPEKNTAKKNDRGGEFIFLTVASKQTLESALAEMNITADVSFDPTTTLTPQTGCINYTHKQKDGKDIYYFINTGDDPLSTTVTLRGNLKNIETWNPHTGEITKVAHTKREQLSNATRLTIMPLSLPSVSSLFIVAERDNVY